MWLAADQGSAAGWYRLGLPSRENLDPAGLDLVVHPAERRRGLGLALLRHAAGRAAAHGRAVLNGGARRGSPGETFARSVGAKPGLVEVQRVLDIGRLEKGKLARLRGPAELELLATTEPQLERISTWNAENNEHMIAINEAMGYAVFGPPTTWFRFDVATVAHLPG